MFSQEIYEAIKTTSPELAQKYWDDNNKTRKRESSVTKDEVTVARALVIRYLSLNHTVVEGVRVLKGTQQALTSIVATEISKNPTRFAVIEGEVKKLLETLTTEGVIAPVRLTKKGLETELDTQKGRGSTFAIVSDDFGALVKESSKTLHELLSEVKDGSDPLNVSAGALEQENE